MRSGGRWHSGGGIWSWFDPQQLPVLFSVVLRALFKDSDPKRFQNIFTTLFTLFTMLTLDDWSLIYIDNRAKGGQRPGSRAWLADTNGLAMSAYKGC